MPEVATTPRAFKIRALQASLNMLFYVPLKRLSTPALRPGAKYNSHNCLEKNTPQSPETSVIKWWKNDPLTSVRVHAESRMLHDNKIKVIEAKESRTPRLFSGLISATTIQTDMLSRAQKANSS